MGKKQNQLSNASSTGGQGIYFENRVQASFVVLMLANGFAPCLPQWPIQEIKFQGKYQGYDTDDLIVFIKQGGNKAKLLGQIKHTVKITNNKNFNKIIQSAWNDFNNKKLFNEGSDVIALISGPLSATDTNDVRLLLGQAQEAKDAFDFLQRISLANFSSNAQRNKLETFKNSLKIANNNVVLTDEQLWGFLKSFRLLIYDLDIKGVTLSLLHSLIGQYSQINANSLWTEIEDIVAWKNEKAGIITLGSISEKIRSVFTRKVTELIPGDLAKAAPLTGEIDWNHAQYASELAVASLIGGWSEKSDSDKKFIGRVAKEDFETWISKMQEVLQQTGSPLSLQNGVWSVTQRQKLWQTLGTRIFDDRLDIFKQYAVTVLAEHDPRFELELNERYAASIYGKVLKHSHFIREGIADSLALLGNQPEPLTKCSLGKPQGVALLAIREIFQDADWVLWGSLNDLLPLLAEASPEEFLNAVETSLAQKTCPFDKLFAQEGNGVMGGNYLTGLLWALEGLAWDEQYLARVSVVLGELASHDPGGTWANRPANSLTTIFLPWLPQTTASVEKRQVAVKTLAKEMPKEAWKLLISLFPSQHQISSGTHKPRWRKIIPSEWNKKVSTKEYMEQVSAYVSMAVEMAKNDISKLGELIEHLDHLTPESFERMFDYLSSKDILGKPESQRLQIWEGLVELVAKHKKYADAEWAMKPEVVARIESVAKKLAPLNPTNLYRRLFSSRDFDLYEEKDGDWQEQQKRLEDFRQKAIKEILCFGGIDTMINFAKAVESPWNVGLSLGYLKEEVDSVILPSLLETTEEKNISQFAGGFVWARYWSCGWGWVDKLNFEAWSRQQRAQFFSGLPFIRETWERVEKLLGANEGDYWSRVNVNPYHAKEDINLAIDKLIKYKRPYSAINCLCRNLHFKQPLDTALAIRALLAAVSSEETVRAADAHDITELITALQKDPKTDRDELFRVEWAYVPLLSAHSGASPKVLEERLSSDHKFFCEIICLMYKSDKKDKSENNPTEQQKAIATNAYKLLREWKTPPGTLPNGSFSNDHFKEWLETVKKECSESGHLDVALSTIGQVLIYAPPDPSGLWINKTVADALNSKDAEAMRSGYRIGIYNSRGVHFVDPTGKPELELSAKYSKQAEDVENAGYHRFASTLRGLAESYTNDAKRIADEHKQEEGEKEDS